MQHKENYFSLLENIRQFFHKQEKINKKHCELWTTNFQQFYLFCVFAGGKNKNFVVL